MSGLAAVGLLALLAALPAAAQSAPQYELTFLGPAASVNLKIPLMVEAFRQIEAGRFSLTDKVTLKESDFRFGTGILRSLSPGAVVTVKDLLMLMNIVSDNTATDLVYEKVGGPARVTAAMREMGFKTIETRMTAFEWFRALSATAR